MPETFLPSSDVEFTMPLATISNTVVRSVSVEQHEDSDRVEKVGSPPLLLNAVFSVCQICGQVPPQS